MTELFLIRHARAVEQAAHDWERPLTADGRKDARTVGAAAAAQGVRFSSMASSPLVRAVETATLFGVETEYAGGLHIDHVLSPDGAVDTMIDLCSAMPGDVVALVGHEPSMGALLSTLIGRPGMTLVKAAVVRLAIDGTPRAGAAKLVWTLSPRQLVPARGG